MKWNEKTIMALPVAGERTIKHPTQGLRLRIRPNGSRAWEWVRTRDGVAHKMALGRFPDVSIDDAAKRAAELNQSLTRGVIQDNTFASVWADYVKDREKVGRSMHNTDLMVRKDAFDTLAMKRLSEITPQDIRKVIAKPLERAKGETGGAVQSNMLLKVLRTFLAWANRQARSDWNPALSVDYIERITGHRETRILSVAEMALVIVAARAIDRESNSSALGDAFTLLCLTGARKAEVFEARANEWDGEFWTLPALRYKTRVAHALPLGEEGRAAMSRLCHDGYLVPSQRYVRTGNDTPLVSLVHDKMEEIAGREIPRWTPHAIRYGFRSGIRKAGIADSELAERMIHPKAKGSFDRHYDPEAMEEMRVALAKWEALINGEIAKCLQI